jgi:hypothetical protein
MEGGGLRSQEGRNAKKGRQLYNRDVWEEVRGKMARGSMFQVYTMRPKARGLTQHGGPPGWLEESYPAGVILFMMYGPYRLPFPYRTGCPDRSCLAAR